MVADLMPEVCNLMNNLPVKALQHCPEIVGSPYATFCLYVCKQEAVTGECIHVVAEDDKPRVSGLWFVVRFLLFVGYCLRFPGGE